MYVMATAGHVDHGKSTLVRALTGTEPDRWEEERRRGLTIDLGFASLTLPSGRVLSFVDVPGHERFLGNMLSGLGPATMVCFAVAADQGWQAQSSDHRDAVAALGISTGLIVITRADLAPERVGAVLEQTRLELSGTGLEGAPAAIVSAAQGRGLDQLRDSLDSVLASAPRPDTHAPVRLWADRAFSLRGAGTVVTGTLAAGTLHREQRLRLVGERLDTTVVVRGLQTRGTDVDTLEAADRAAVNLRGVSADQLSRGDVLLSPEAWHLTRTVDVRSAVGEDFAEAPDHLTVHLGAAAVPARCRRLDDHHARLTLARPLPVQVGDRLLLQALSARTVHAGVQVLDVDPPALNRRGQGRRRGQALSLMPLTGDLAAEVRRREAAEEAALRRMGLQVPKRLGPELRRVEGWLVHADQIAAWSAQLRELISNHVEHNPLSPGLSEDAAVDYMGLPVRALLPMLIREVGLRQQDGRISSADTGRGLGAAESAVAALENQLAREPFLAPEAKRLHELGLGDKELAAAARQGRLLRLTGGVVLLPRAPAQAMQILARLDQPFTTSAARQALGTTRRVAVPLLEHLDSRGWTRRADGSTREIVH